MSNLKPSSGAMRAARALSWRGVEAAAAIIDRESGIADAIKALELVLAEAEGQVDRGDRPMKAAMVDYVRAALNRLTQ